MSAITAKASRKMKKYAVLTREPRCFLGSFDFSWEQRKLTEFVEFFSGLTYTPNDVQENGTLVLRSSNVSNGEVVDADNVYVNPQVVNSENVKVGDIVVVVRNGSRSLIGKHAQIKAFMPNTVIGAFMTGIRSECPEFTNALLNTSRFEEEIAMNMGATINQITGYMFSKMEFKVPCLDEQKKIGEYFEKLDRLVTLHQRKCALLFSPFQAFISMMFTTSTFSWEQRKLGDVVQEITRNDPESEAPIMMITANNGFIEQSERYAFNNAGESLKKYILLKKGELAYNHGASKLRPYGSCFALTTAENARIPFVYHCFSAENQNAEFMSIELNGAEIENQLRKIVSSGARMDGLLNISFDEYTSVSVLLPNTEEQDRIADFFRQLDHLITLHQRKCIFFTGRAGRLISTVNKKRITSSWEQRKLTEFVEFFSGLTYTPNDVQENGTLVLRSSNVSNGEVVDADNVYVNPQVVNSENVKVGDIVVVVRNGSRSLIGKHAQIKAFMPNTVIGAFMTGIRSECPEFTNALLNTSRFEEEIAMNMGATINQITGYMFSKMEFKVPCLDEQKKIGEYFEKLDRLVTLHQRKPFLMKWRTSDANRNQTNRLVL